ncbi:MAG: NVEALA domain-containing protein [Prevotellaceae bacterium]|jgi:hypothetical protein|nr:NVEALA domain-containing protein [Prevotellaceae bacterium]
MKRIIIGILIFSGLLAGVSYSVLCANHKPQITDLVLKNVEALAQGESSSTFCLGHGEVECYGAKVEVKYTGLR